MKNVTEKQKDAVRDVLKEVAIGQFIFLVGGNFYAFSNDLTETSWIGALAGAVIYGLIHLYILLSHKEDVVVEVKADKASSLTTERQTALIARFNAEDDLDFMKMMSLQGA